MKIVVFWDIPPCSPVEVHLRLPLTGYLLRLLFDPEDGGSIFIRNFEGLLLDYTVLHPEDRTPPDDFYEKATLYIL
jgi:hypothetical protein